MAPDTQPIRRKKRRPHTGSPEALRARSQRIRRLVYLLFAVVLVFSAAVVYRAKHPKQDPNAPILVAEHFVNARLGDSYVVKFSPPEWTKVEQSGDTVTVSGSLEAVARSGSSAASYTYICVLNNADATWNLMSLDLMKQ